MSGLLFSLSLGCGEVGSTAAGGVSAVISVLMASVIGSGEFWAGAVSGKISGFCANSAGSTAGKFDRPQIIARHT